MGLGGTWRELIVGLTWDLCGGTWHFICSRQVSAPEVNRLICMKICIFLKKKKKKVLKE